MQNPTAIQNNMKNTAIACFVMALLTVVFGVGVYVSPYLYDQPAPDPAYPIQLATNLDDLTLDGDLLVGEDATIGNAFAVTGAATLSGDATIDDILSIDENIVTYTGAATLTPSATFYQLAPVSETLTLTLATASADEGDLLILQSIVSTATTIVDTGATVGGSTVVLGENDLAIFIYGNSKWIEVASPDNS